MPSLPAADQVAKVEILGKISGVPCVNVMHWRKATAIAAGDVLTLATAIKNAWQTNMLPQQRPTYTLDGVRATDLTSLAGEQAMAVSGAVGTKGTVDGPASAAQVVTIHTAVRARSARGRIYIGGIPGDVYATPQTFSTAYTNLLVTAFNAVITAGLNAGATANWALGVLSYYTVPVPKGPSVLRPTPVFTPFTSVSYSTKVESQRRRLG